jgi:hypothetical protein
MLAMDLTGWIGGGTMADLVFYMPARTFGECSDMLLWREQVTSSLAATAILTLNFWEANGAPLEALRAGFGPGIAKQAAMWRGHEEWLIGLADVYLTAAERRAEAPAGAALAELCVTEARSVFEEYASKIFWEGMNREMSLAPLPWPEEFYAGHRSALCRLAPEYAAKFAGTPQDIPFWYPGA